ncbi:hypothetical protein NPIL_392151 [Nephila pilipes]|uniref:Uncharacterized protein n=1 Tax=Nephila pilipes TaxID=299642 RepID=A0A8X6TCJ8_NEPPI|nr:hypothetical protein NPIL_392151 [Nephila pilipes]
MKLLGEKKLKPSYLLGKHSEKKIGKLISKVLVTSGRIFPTHDGRDCAVDLVYKGESNLNPVGSKKFRPVLLLLQMLIKKKCEGSILCFNLPTELNNHDFGVLSYHPRIDWSTTRIQRIDLTFPSQPVDSQIQPIQPIFTSINCNNQL